MQTQSAIHVPISDQHDQGVTAYTPVSIIVPTFREVENIPVLIQRVAQLREKSGMKIELLFVDDNSQDGSVEVVNQCGHDWVRMIVRRYERGLSSAVLTGFRVAIHPVLVCMDCDLSHPPEKIPEMIRSLESGKQFVIGSRYVAGGSTDASWGVLRWLNSRVATGLARPLTSVNDPMSGFFAMRRADFDIADGLNPVGYKIALELIVKCQFDHVGEIPIHFSDRVLGESKLTAKVALRYLQHLCHLYTYKFTQSIGVPGMTHVGDCRTVLERRC